MCWCSIESASSVWTDVISSSSSDSLAPTAPLHFLSQRPAPEEMYAPEPTDLKVLPTAQARMSTSMAAARFLMPARNASKLCTHAPSAFNHRMAGGSSAHVSHLWHALCPLAMRGHNMHRRSDMPSTAKDQVRPCRATYVESLLSYSASNCLSLS